MCCWPPGGSSLVLAEASYRRLLAILVFGTLGAARVDDVVKTEAVSSPFSRKLVGIREPEYRDEGPRDRRVVVLG